MKKKIKSTILVIGIILTLVLSSAAAYAYATATMLEDARSEAFSKPKIVDLGLLRDDLDSHSVYHFDIDGWDCLIATGGGSDFYVAIACE